MLDDLHSEDGHGRQAERTLESHILPCFPSISRAAGEDRTGAELDVVSRLPVGLTGGPQIPINTIKVSVSMSAHVHVYVRACVSGVTL